MRLRKPRAAAMRETNPAIGGSNAEKRQETELETKVSGTKLETKRIAIAGQRQTWRLRLETRSWRPKKSQSLVKDKPGDRGKCNCRAEVGERRVGKRRCR